MAFGKQLSKNQLNSSILSDAIRHKCPILLKIPAAITYEKSALAYFFHLGYLLEEILNFALVIDLVTSGSTDRRIQHKYLHLEKLILNFFWFFLFFFVVWTIFGVIRFTLFEMLIPNLCQIVTTISAELPIAIFSFAAHVITVT